MGKEVISECFVVVLRCSKLEVWVSFSFAMPSPLNISFGETHSTPYSLHRQLLCNFYCMLKLVPLDCSVQTTTKKCLSLNETDQLISFKCYLVYGNILEQTRLEHIFIFFKI